MKNVNVVLNEGSGVIINQLFNDWLSIKTERQHKYWSNKVKNTTFGTYGIISIFEVLDNFKFNESKINQITKNAFLSELKTSLK